MREVKKHWFRWVSEGKNWRLKGDAQMQVPLCGLLTTKFANKKRAVTCKTCARILAGYQTKEK
jgi:hypothetical protein